MTLGECINNYLNEHKMSMRKFATLSGVSHAYISNIVNGKTSRGNSPVPSIDVYRGVAKAMGIDVQTLIAMVDDEIAWGEQKKKPATTKGDGSEEKYEEIRQIFDELNLKNAESLREYALFLLQRQKSQDDQ